MGAVQLPKDLQNVNLSHTKLPKDLSKHNLTGANLSYTDLSGAIQLPKDLQNVNLSHTKLPKDLSKHNLTGANLSYTDLSGAIQLPKDLHNVNLSHTKLPKDFSKHNLTGANLSYTNLVNVALPQDLSYTNLSQAQLPRNFSKHNLSNAIFTGQKFTSTNFSDAQLKNVTLTNTTCDYLTCFQKNMYTMQDKEWYFENLFQELERITKIYPRISQDSHKAALLQIACGLAFLPHYKDTEFYIKVQYWSCKLLVLREQLVYQPSCILANYLTYDAQHYCCWKITNPPEKPIAEEEKNDYGDNIDNYLAVFNLYSNEKRFKWELSYGYDYYTNHIKKSLRGLEKAYPHLHDPVDQKEAIYIAGQLAQSYDNKQNLPFLLHYLTCQNRLVNLRYSGKTKDIDLHATIYYRPIALHSYTRLMGITDHMYKKNNFQKPIAQPLHRFTIYDIYNTIASYILDDCQYQENLKCFRSVFIKEQFDIQKLFHDDIDSFKNKLRQGVAPLLERDLLTQETLQKILKNLYMLRESQKQRLEQKKDNLLIHLSAGEVAFIVFSSPLNDLLKKIKKEGIMGEIVFRLLFGK